MRNFDETNLTAAVVSRFDACPDPRLREVMVSLVQHLHGFVREVRPTEAEWFEAIRLLTACGQKCDDKRQEFILLSDTLGVSMLVDAINHARGGAATETTVLGPFYVGDQPEFAFGADISGGKKGVPLYGSGTIRGPDGRPLAGAIVDVWQADDEGFYDIQSPDGGLHLRGRLRTDAEGRYAFWSILPTHYPIPTDGPVGRLLSALERHPYRPAHVHFMISAPGCERLVTHVFAEGDPYIDSDVVFGVKDSLIQRFERQPAGRITGGRVVDRAHATMTYDFALAPARAEGRAAAE